MIVKPSVSFLKNHADAVLITTTSGILSGMTGNPHFPAPSPTLPVLASALDDFSIALANAADGGKALTAAKNAQRAALKVLLRELAAYLQVACKGNLAALLSSGFPNQKPHRQPVGILPAPANVSVTFGQRTGELSASFSPVVGASAYNWRVTTAAEPEVVVLSVQSTAASNTLTGLTRGVVYRVQANAVGAAGPGNWSAPVLQMVV
jgi:fibronectin type III domain protein